MTINQKYLKSLLSNYAATARLRYQELKQLDAHWLISQESAIDQLLGTDTHAAEAQDFAHSNNPELYLQDCSPPALNSSYLDIFRMLHSIPKNLTIHDLGAGNGRIGLVNHILGSPHHFYGYEFLDSRINPARAILAQEDSHQRNHFCTRDLIEDPLRLQRDHWYFCYLPIGAVIRSFLRTLLDQASALPINFAFVESHGDFKDFIASLFGIENIRIAPLALMFPRHDRNLYYLKIHQLDLDKLNHRSFWKAYLLNNSCTEILSRNQHGGERWDSLADCQLSFYQSEPYLILPGYTLSSFHKTFTWQIAMIR